MLSDKKIAKIQKVLGTELLADLEKLQVDVLKDTLVSAEHSIMEATRELEANPKYEDIKESLKALSSGLREVKQRQNAVIAYILSLLEDRAAK